MRIYLVRHGQTALNEKNLVQGHIDWPLSLAGKAQADKLAKHLAGIPFDETARGILAGRVAQPIKVDGRLKSRFQGSLQGKEWIPGMSYPDDAEPEVEITNRLCSWLTELLDAHSPDSSPVQSPATKTSFDVTLPREPTVLAVTHTECVTALMRLFTAAHQQCKDILPCQLDMHVSEDIRARLDVPNAGFAVLRVRWEDKEGSLLPKGEVERWGVTEHLA